MTNVSEFAQTQNGDIVMYFSGKYATFTLVNGAKVTFVMENPATGIKSEQEELYQGIFFMIVDIFGILESIWYIICFEI